MGLFYTLLSRFTAIKNLDDKLSSAIYFNGANMNTGRLLNINLNTKGHKHAMAKKKIHMLDICKKMNMMHT